MVQSTTGRYSGCVLFKLWLFATSWPAAPNRLLCPWDSQARILEWVTIFSFRGSSWPRDWTCISCISRRILYPWATREAQRACVREVIWYRLLQAPVWGLLNCHWQRPLGFPESGVREWGGGRVWCGVVKGTRWNLCDETKSNLSFHASSSLTCLYGVSCRSPAPGVSDQSMSTVPSAAKVPHWPLTSAGRCMEKCCHAWHSIKVSAAVGCRQTHCAPRPRA